MTLRKKCLLLLGLFLLFLIAMGEMAYDLFTQPQMDMMTETALRDGMVRCVMVGDF